ncbi:NYN domain-containing protein [Jatrophihabitans sp.]|uniref:NYN domain-containing protein n=1 Tax=Jatrophihabitans sp. TaxID=1932789 RepID=UPI002CE1DCB6|nr:NYN domain-containing protein [Jatrophihabitans sp.]
MAPKTNIYVDGFNLYYALRKTPYKWLDLGRLFRQMFPSNDIQRIRYCTARIKARPGDPTGPDRQDAYLRALSTVPGLETHFGTFLASKTYARLVTPPPPPAPPTVRVHKMEEKGSDVNLGTWMVIDAYENDCDVAVLVTNDSDLAFPMQVVSQRIGHPVGIVNPFGARTSQALLRQQPAFKRDLSHRDFAAAQFPPVVMVNGRPVTKPRSW